MNACHEARSIFLWKMKKKTTNIVKIYQRRSLLISCWKESCLSAVRKSRSIQRPGFSVKSLHRDSRMDQVTPVFFRWRISVLKAWRDRCSFLIRRRYVELIIASVRIRCYWSVFDSAFSIFFPIFSLIWMKITRGWVLFRNWKHTI